MSAPRAPRPLVLGFVALLLAAGCSPPPDPRPDVVLIVIDTFRPDHLGVNGYERRTAPFLEDLMQRSTVFDHAYSTSSWTAPATSSLFTALYPTRHGVTEGFLAHQRRSETLEELAGVKISLNRLPEDVATLPELLRREGYQTFGLASNINIGPEIGFDRGFDRFTKMTERSAKKLAEQLRGWRRKIAAARPCFLYLHFNDVHEPYLERAPWYEEKDEPLARTVSAYDSEISFLDAVLAELYQEFGWSRGTLLTVVSDHGEELGERGRVGHHFSLQDELMRVLWVVAGDDLGIPAARLGVAASLIDVAPTILDLVGIPPPAGRQGRSLARFVVGGGAEESPAEERTLFAHRLRHRLRAGLSDQHLWAAVRGPWKLIAEPDGPRLYDLERDPAERVDRSAENPGQLADLTRRLDGFRAVGFPQSGAATEVELDRETLETLKSLGYVQ